MLIGLVPIKRSKHNIGSNTKLNISIVYHTHLISSSFYSGVQEGTLQ